ncbi:MAG: hypothetical protein WBS20_18320 [Lysobacterales bacterium]
MYASEDVVSLSGSFGSFIALGADVTEVERLGPDRLEPALAEDQRVSSTWYYFSSQGIRVRVCDDDHLVGTVNAINAPATRKYVTEANIRIGDNLDRTKSLYGEALQPLPESNGNIWFIQQEAGDNQITFGFRQDGTMVWVALGALRENGWTCGKPVIHAKQEHRD